MQAARILVDGQSDLVLDYGIPPEAGDVKPGCRVQVPLRNRTATGIKKVLAPEKKTPYNGGKYSIYSLIRIFSS